MSLPGRSEPVLCLPAASEEGEWLPLLQMAVDFGWPVDVSLL